MEDIFGIIGERAGKGKVSEQIFRGEGSAPAPRNEAAADYARKLEGKQKEGQEALLRADILKLDENIQAITASIDNLTAKIREGARIASEQGNERLHAINVRLEEETQREKISLLEEKERLEAERQKLQGELGEL
jgi:hypothetical protein